MNYVVLRDVIDVRTWKYHSVVRVKQQYVRYFIPAEEE